MYFLEFCHLQGQIGFGSSCYQVLPEVVPFDVADGMCEIRKGHLVALSSAEENGRVASWLNTVSKDPFWIGLTDQEERKASPQLLGGVNGTNRELLGEGGQNQREATQQFTWTNGEHVEFVNWGTGQPSKTRNSNLPADE
jgi:hypothetical protein